MTVIKYGDTPKDMILKMSEGNIGAITVLMSLTTSKEIAKIDPAILSPWLYLTVLDMGDIRADKIWGLAKYCCEQDETRLVAAIRALQLGIVSREELRKNIEERTSLDFTKAVQEELPEFAPEVPKDLGKTAGGGNVKMFTAQSPDPNPYMGPHKWVSHTAGHPYAECSVCGVLQFSPGAGTPDPTPERTPNGAWYAPFEPATCERTSK